MARAALTRRQLLRHCTLMPLAALPVLQGCTRDSGAQCADPDLLSAGEAQMRKTRQYIEISDVTEKHCSSCRFFDTPDAEGCGFCEILGGSVNNTGYCNSWAQRS
jgi:High potential iron-sulfur protein